MNSPDKLPLVKSAMKILLEQLDENGSVAIAVYVVVLGLVLHPASVSSRRFECWMLDQLWSRNSACVRNGREESESGRRKPGHVPHRWRLQRWSYGPLGFVDLMQPEAKYGVFLSVLEFGTGNLKDATKEQLADKGSGNNGSLQQACKLLVEDALEMLLIIAKYVKIQVDFNQQHVQAYRLIGYDNRMLQFEDFRNDKKAVGEIGSGHTVTALYEIVPV